ncbi:MAG: hypothetical protein ACRD29_26015, partial [Acidimicrobiales bacterium]
MSEPAGSSGLDPTGSSAPLASESPADSDSAQPETSAPTDAPPSGARKRRRRGSRGGRGRARSASKPVDAGTADTADAADDDATPDELPEPAREGRPRDPAVAERALVRKAPA